MTDWRAIHGQYFQSRRVLVTGGAGFIGSHLCRALASLGAQVIALDDLSAGDRANLADTPVTLAEASILDEAAMHELTQRCDVIFHQAALGSVPRSVEQPGLYVEVNIRGTQRLLEAARFAGVRRVVFAASSSAYGDAPTLPKIETMPPSPRSPYAATKLAGEALMSAYSASYGLDTACLRYFNIFGPRQSASSAYAAVIAAFASALLNGRRPVIFGDGTQSRDFTHVDNAVHANLLAARADPPIGGAVLNIATGRRITVNELAIEMAKLIGRPDLTPEYRPPRAGDVAHSQADLSAARSILGYEPLVDFEAGLRETVAWYRGV